MPPATIPVATYRLQFNAAFTFADATAIVDYLHALGISHAYASSYFKAVPGSTHGYDVADPTQLNPEIGDARSYGAWVDALRAHGMGHIIDLVPNHMGIATSANPWWQDVLENGPSSRHAQVFDIDWHPLKPELENKVLLPILGDSYGAVLERQEIRLEYQAGAFHVRYFEQVLPIAPGHLRPHPRHQRAPAARRDRRRQRGRHRVPQHRHGHPAPAGPRRWRTGSCRRNATARRK